MITLIVVSRFENVIEAFLRNVGTMKLPGGFEFQTQKPTPPEALEGEADSKPEEKLPSGQEETLADQLEELHKLNTEDKQRLEQQFDNAVQWANYWRWMYPKHVLRADH